jgi:general secretion pathway protein G
MGRRSLLKTPENRSLTVTAQDRKPAITPTYTTANSSERTSAGFFQQAPGVSRNPLTGMRQRGFKSPWLCGSSTSARARFQSIARSRSRNGQAGDADSRCTRLSRNGVSPRRRNQRGLTLVELIVAFTIMLILTTMAVPMARSRVRRERERELRYALREIRNAIDKYKDMADSGQLPMQKLGGEGYPESLEVLVEGVKVTGQVEKKIRFLRRVPVDPFTNSKDWGKRSTQDDPKSNSWGGQNVFDVYTKTTEKAADGTPYSEW